MIRLKGIFGLAALVFLAGCVAGIASLPEIPSPNGVEVTRSCNSVEFERFEILEARDFVMHEDSRGRFNVKVDRDNAEIVLPFISQGPGICRYFLKFDNFGNTNSFDISPIPKSERALLPTEKDAFTSEAELCSSPALVGNGTGTTLAYFSETEEWLDQGVYIGCEADARYQTTGMIVQIGSTRFRIVQTMRRLTVTKLEAS